MTFITKYYISELIRIITLSKYKLSNIAHLHKAISKSIDT